MPPPGGGVVPPWGPMPPGMMPPPGPYGTPYAHWPHPMAAAGAQQQPLQQPPISSADTQQPELGGAGAAMPTVGTTPPAKSASPLPGAVGGVSGAAGSSNGGAGAGGSSARQQQIQRRLRELQKQHSELLRELQLHATEGYSEFDTLYTTNTSASPSLLATLLGQSQHGSSDSLPMQTPPALGGSLGDSPGLLLSATTPESTTPGGPALGLSSSQAHTPQQQVQQQQQAVRQDSPAGGALFNMGSPGNPDSPQGLEMVFKRKPSQDSYNMRSPLGIFNMSSPQSLPDLSDPGTQSSVAAAAAAQAPDAAGGNRLAARSSTGNSAAAGASGTANAQAVELLRQASMHSIASQSATDFASTAGLFGQHTAAQVPLVCSLLLWCCMQECSWLWLPHIATSPQPWLPAWPTFFAVLRHACSPRKHAPHGFR